MTNILFISGYTTRNTEVYHAYRAVAEAAGRAGSMSHHSMTFPITKIGRHQVLPAFSEMVALAQDSVRAYAPDIIIGHCVGAAVAVRLLQNEGEATATKAILLCPPVGLIAAEQLENPQFRIFCKPTGVPKALFSSQQSRQAMMLRAKTVLAAAEIFGEVERRNLAAVPPANLLFVSCSKDTLCDRRATARLAMVLGSTHHELEDNHSIKAPESIERIAAMIAACSRLNNVR